MKLDLRLEQIRSCVVLKDAIAENFAANEHHSFTSVFTFSVVVVDLPTDRILTFFFPAETNVLAPVFSQSTDVVVVNFVVVLKFLNSALRSVFLISKESLWIVFPYFVAGTKTSDEL